MVASGRIIVLFGLLAALVLAGPAVAGRGEPPRDPTAVPDPVEEMARLHADLTEGRLDVWRPHHRRTVLTLPRRDLRGADPELARLLAARERIVAGSPIAEIERDGRMRVRVPGAANPGWIGAPRRTRDGIAMDVLLAGRGDDLLIARYLVPATRRARIDSEPGPIAAQEPPAPAASATDASPPVVTIGCPAADGDYLTSLEEIWWLAGEATDDVGVTGITWSTDAGASGTASSWRTASWYVGRIPLHAGTNVITVTAHDASGRTGSDSFVVVSQPSPSDLHVDCSAPGPGDGSPGAPLTSLREAVDYAVEGSTITLHGGPCTDTALISRGVTIQGEPSLPRPVIADAYNVTGEGCIGWIHTLEVDSSRPVTLRRLALAQGAAVGLAQSDSTVVDVTLEDVTGGKVICHANELGGRVGLDRTDDTLIAGMCYGGLHRFTIEDSSGIAFAPISSGSGFDLVGRRTRFDALSISDHGAYRVDLEDSEITGSGLDLVHFGRNGMYPLHLRLAGSRVAGSRVGIEYAIREFYNAQPTVSIDLERNEFVDSTLGLDFRTFRDDGLDQGRTLDHAVRVAGNLFVRSGLDISLLDYSAANIRTGLGILNNTFVGAITGVDVEALFDPISGGIPSDWTLDVANNVVAGGQTGIRVNGLTHLDAAIVNNDVTGASLALYDGDLPDLTGTDGNISEDPLFSDPAAGDYSIAGTSPCVDAGATLPGLPSRDLAGVSRPLDGDGDGVASFDIGAYEFVRCVDLDGDGVCPADGDCDDTRADVNPGAVELPGNLLDENCDGELSCDPAGAWLGQSAYLRCVVRSCDMLVASGRVTPETCARLVAQAGRLQQRAGAD